MRGWGFSTKGEEFVHVLEGQVEVQVGDHVNVLSTGDSLHFNSGIKHDLRNPADTDAQLIVVVYVP
jgi:quercetin dioxygenase-like cupin family protein